MVRGPDASADSWPNMCVDVGLTSRAVASLIDEAQQLTKIFIAAQVTAKRRNR